MNLSIKVQLTLIIAVIYLSSVMIIEGTPIILVDKNYARRYCSKHLSNALRFVCDSFYAEYLQESNYKRSNFKGIVDECCHNPCTLDVLRSYCSFVQSN